MPETEQPADNVVAHAISAGIPATSLPAVLVLAEADTMTSVAQWADMQQKRERAHGRKPLKAETQQTLAAAGNSEQNPSRYLGQEQEWRRPFDSVFNPRWYEASPCGFDSRSALHFERVAECKDALMLLA